MRTHKESLHQQQQDAEDLLIKQHRDRLNLETRKIQRRKVLQYNHLQYKLLHEVRQSVSMWEFA